MIDKFNIRVYGICIVNDKILALKEEYAGQTLIKLPGGGLEFGETTIDCLKREFSEELNLSIKIKSHYYTQEEFLVSRFKSNEQLLTIYYLCEIENLEDLIISDPLIEQIMWLPITEDNQLELPIDRIVFEKIKNM